MNLLTKTTVSKLPKLYETEDIELDEKIAQVKLFTPWTNWTWYVVEFDGQNQCFGYVEGFDNELGYFSLSELASIQGPFGLNVERDKFFEPTKLKDIMK